MLADDQVTYSDSWQTCRDPRRPPGRRRVGDASTRDARPDLHREIRDPRGLVDSMAERPTPHVVPPSTTETEEEQAKILWEEALKIVKGDAKKAADYLEHLDMHPEFEDQLAENVRGRVSGPPRWQQKAIPNNSTCASCDADADGKKLLRCSRCKSMCVVHFQKYLVAVPFNSCRATLILDGTATYSVRFVPYFLLNLFVIMSHLNLLL